ncbi:helix-turn-helix transcriptional regulator [Actinospica sp.]|uniref:helix-turn-helix transcriptional regulator n=1 Tax=Actinospica sp. TaxID=1872142 RepID=UPI002BF774D0|nr:helix-turn-helix transcriptional regulator [Actinospica sp.]HWG27799.1 helix-turn-helix transcriptional regulator [Actinospica sp.]
MTDLAAVKNSVRRTELADFLRSRRERIAPEQAGLPPAPRRRTPGLRREEVAQLAGVGVTWYTWLEQGRRINASTQVLDAVARTLQLDAAEHRHLYTLAQVPDLRAAEAEGCALPPEIQPILDGMHNVATVVNETFDMVATNRHFDVMFPSVLAQPKENHNVFWCMFNLPECCHPFVNRHETIPQMVAMLRGAYARHVGEPRWEKLIRDLIDYSELFAELWSRNEVAAFGKQLRVYYQPAVGLLRFISTSLGIHGTNGLRMQIMIPVDEATATAHARLLSGEAEHPDVLPCGHTWQDWLHLREDKPPLGSAAVVAQAARSAA